MNEKRFYEILGKNIRTLRNENRFKQAELAEEIGLERTSITNIETGKQKVTIFSLYQICAIFDVHISDLLPKPEEIVEYKVNTDNESGEVVLGAKSKSILDRLRTQ